MSEKVNKKKVYEIDYIYNKKENEENKVRIKICINKMKFVREFGVTAIYELNGFVGFYVENYLYKYPIHIELHRIEEEIEEEIDIDYYIDCIYLDYIPLKDKYIETIVEYKGLLYNILREYIEDIYEFFSK